MKMLSNDCCCVLVLVGSADSPAEAQNRDFLAILQCVGAAESDVSSRPARKIVRLACVVRRWCSVYRLVCVTDHLYSAREAKVFGNEKSRQFWFITLPQSASKSAGLSMSLSLDFHGQPMPNVKTYIIFLNTFIAF